MKIRKSLFAIIILLCIPLVNFAQLTDAQVIETVKQAQAQGKSQDEIILLLSQKGVTQAQVERIKSGYEQPSAGVVQSSNRERLEKVSSENQPISQHLTENDVFGRNMFNNKKLTFEPNLNIPTPDNYKLGPGDEIIIDIWGNSEASIKQQISPEGSIYISGLGPIYLNGKLIQEATAYLKKVFSKIYADLNSSDPKTFLKLSLGQIRSIKVNIMGEVVMPGTYTLPSLATVFHALYSAGGISNVGTLRNIKLYRNGNLLKNIDIYEYITKGNNSCDITLQDGDNLNIGTFEKIISLTGKVKRPMRYELKKEETIKDILEYAGGFSSDAYKKNLTLMRKGNTEYQIFTVESEEYPDLVLNNGDVLRVDAILNKFSNRVTIEGSVYRPGDFALSNKLNTLKELVSMAEGVKGDAFLERTILYREKEDLTTEILSIDLKKLLNGETEDLQLKKNDRLYVPSRNSLREGYTIEIHGEVKNPQTYSYVDNMTLEDAVVQAGGLKESASVIRVDVSRRIKAPKNTEEVPNEAQLFSFALKDGLTIEGKENFILEPFDEIYVRRSPAYREQQNVYIEGEIMYSGVYAKSNVNERLSDLVKRAGGVTSKAYIKGARLIRQMNKDEYLKVTSALKLARNSQGDSISIASLDIGNSYYVGIDLYKALQHPGSDHDIVLRAGDRLHIPNLNSTVKISGAVMYPNAITYDKNKKLKSYIENAGGYAYRAKKKKVYILYMNGMIATRKHMRNPKIEPGCEIIVPMKTTRKGFGWTEFMSTATSTTSLAAMVTAILNNTK